jgi:hypothetical protein
MINNLLKSVAIVGIIATVVILFFIYLEVKSDKYITRDSQGSIIILNKKTGQVYYFYDGEYFYVDKKGKEITIDKLP